MIETLLRASWQGALFALVAWVICRLWRKMPASVACVIWLLVCVKLLAGLCPVAFSLPVLPAEKMVARALPAGDQLIEISPDEVVRVAAPVDYRLWVWLAGVGGLVLFVLLALWRLRNLLRNASPVADPAFENLVKEMGLRRVPRLLETDADIEVLTFGALKPCVVVSRSMRERCSAEEMRLILAHELAHLKRGDAWLALLPQAATALFFFHPAAWLAAREFELAREAACDEIAIQRLRVGSDVYGRLLLKVSARREFAGSYFVMGISSHFRALSRRIAMLHRLSSDSKPRRTLAVVGLAGLLFVMPWTLVHAQSDPIAKPSTVTKPTGSDPLAKPAQKPKIDYAKYLKVDFYQCKYVKVQDAIKALAARKDKSLELSPDIRSNSTFVTGPKEKVDAYVVLLRGYDQKKPTVTAPKAGETIVVSPGANGDATELGKQIMKELKSKFNPKDFKVLVNIGANLVIIDADPKIQKEVVAYVKTIKPTKPQPKSEMSLQVFSLKYQNAGEMAKILQNMAGPDSGCSAVADERTNSVIVKAWPAMMLKFKGWIAALDRETKSSDPVTKPELTLRKIVLQHVDSKVALDRLKEKLEELGVDFASYDPTDNSIIVRAELGKMDDIQQLIIAVDHP